MRKIILGILCITKALHSDNQTADTSPILNDASVPFTISIELEDFALPMGLQSAAAAQCGSEYLFIAGRTNGLHSFNNDDNNFPPNQQNTTVFVINTRTKTVKTRSLYDALSGLTQQQIDSLSVTSPQYYQRGNTLYIAGGYGVDTATGTFSTKDTLSAINVPGLIRWVTHPQDATNARSYIRQTTHPLLQVTGGYMNQFGKNPTLLMFGQNFPEAYTPSSNGIYTEQIRRFYIYDKGGHLKIIPQSSTTPYASFRRRDLNVVPIIEDTNIKKIARFVALSGVFTPSFGIWTVPVDITANGSPYMKDPALPTAFKQGMNNYICAHTQLLAANSDMYIILFGGITYGYFQNGQFFTDAELPFTNEITVIKRNNTGNYQQYILPTEYPTIISTASNPGNTLLFGTSGKFMPRYGVPKYENGVLALSTIKKSTVIGYIIGGIQSTFPNTFSPSDTAASPYIFKVVLTPR